MKSRTIRKVIRAKVDAWLASIDDPDLRELLKKNVIVTGGCIASMLLKERVNDFDIYFRTREAAIKTAEYYVRKFSDHLNLKPGRSFFVDTRDPERVQVYVKSAGVAGTDEEIKQPYQYFERSANAPDNPAGERYVEQVMTDPAEIEDTAEEIQDAVSEQPDSKDEDYHLIFVTSNCMTLSGRVQLILRFYGEPEEIHRNYDFVHCTNYWTSWEGRTERTRTKPTSAGELHLNAAALESLLSRELKYVGSKYPICSLIRLRKFIKRGFTINAGQIVKMVLQVSELNLKDLKVLQDQLTGVDVAYFFELMEKVKAEDPAKVNAAYIIEIIDRLY